jgi:hypothetical protein
VDANLLLVYIVGKTDLNALSRLHHTKQYEDDFFLVERVVEWFDRIYTTPNVLTEVSNLGKKVGQEFFITLSQVIRLVEERYCTSLDASEDEHFPRLGLTDACLFAFARDHLIITADLDLYLALRANDLDAVNFNHLRPYGWTLS